MKTIPLVGSDARATVDDEDYEKLAGSKWGIRRKAGPPFYAFRSVDGRKEQMAEAILGPPPFGMMWDHKDGNGLNNQRSSLRAASRTQNRWNTGKIRRITSSRFKGVTKRGRRWVALMTVRGKTLHIGSFAVEEDAARAYDEAARRLHGEFACVNFPCPGERGCLVS